MFLKSLFKRFANDKKDKESQELCDMRKVLKQELALKDNCIDSLKEQLARLEKVQSNSRKKDHIKIMDAVIEVLKKADRDLSVREVFSKIDKKKLRNKKPTISTAKTTIYYLVRRKKVQPGVTRGTYCLKNSPWDPR